jgi:hypothetical protein
VFLERDLIAAGMAFQLPPVFIIVRQLIPIIRVGCLRGLIYPVAAREFSSFMYCFLRGIENRRYI